MIRLLLNKFFFLYSSRKRAQSCDQENFEETLQFIIFL